MANKIAAQCTQCKKDLELHPYRFKNSKNFFCNQECRGIWMAGKPTWNKGKKGVLSLQAIKNMSEAQKKSKFKAELRYNWKGGTWPYWQATIRKRDNYTCIVCGLFDPEIVEVAHIKPIRGLKNRITSGNPLNSFENLTTLCPNCHARYDKGIIEL